jgi:hypothetical protein
LIGDWIRNDTELAIAKTFEEKRIGDFDKQDMTKLVELMAKWKLLLGVTTETTSQELIEICKFVYGNFKRFTLSDVTLAMNWAISGKTDMSYVSVKSMSAMYVSKAINLYEEEKRNIVNRIAESKAAYERKKSRDEIIQVTPQEKADTFKTILIDAYDDYKNKGSFNDLGDFVYNWMKNNKIFNPSKQDINDAMIYGETKLRELRKLEIEDRDKFKQLTKYLQSQDDETRKKKFAREYVISKFFDKVGLGQLVSYIKLEQFQNK